MRTFLWTIAAATLCGVLAEAQPPGTPDNHDIHLIGSVKGPALYQAYCAVCHGADAKGDGPMAKSLTTPPPDLTRIAARHAGKFPAEQINHIITGDAPLPRGHGTRQMPIWGPAFSKVEGDQDWGLVRIDNLVKYLKEIQAK